MPAKTTILAHRPLPALALMAFAGAAALTGACVGYNVYPPMEGERGFTNVNSDPFPPVILASLQWVTTRYPPEAQAEWNQPAAGQPGPVTYAVNMPQGMNRLISERIVGRLGPGAQPMVPGNEGLPTYHVSRVWVSGDEAKVDIVRPVTNVAFTGQGKPVTQGITVRLRGGVNPWHVTSHRVWSFNAMAVPALNYIQGEGLERAPAPEAAPAMGERGGE
jgi:hypothetical protein